jgi:hypothetical protein
MEELHDDVLTHILAAITLEDFDESFLDERYGPEIPSTRLRKCLLYLPLVCRRWRQLIHSSGRFWVTSLRTDRHSIQQAPGLEGSTSRYYLDGDSKKEWYRRLDESEERRSSLDVLVIPTGLFSTPNPVYWPRVEAENNILLDLIKSLGGHSCRIWRLTLAAPLLVACQINDFPSLGRLEWLTVHDCVSENIPSAWMQGVVDLTRANNLKALEISRRGLLAHISFPPPSAFSVTQFKFDEAPLFRFTHPERFSPFQEDDLERLILFTQGLKGLRELTFKALDIAKEIDPAIEQTTMPNLRRFKIKTTMSSFLRIRSMIDISTITSLDLHINPCDIHWPTEVWEPVILTQPLARLLDLKLKGPWIWVIQCLISLSSRKLESLLLSSENEVPEKLPFHMFPISLPLPTTRLASLSLDFAMQPFRSEIQPFNWDAIPSLLCLEAVTKITIIHHPIRSSHKEPLFSGEDLQRLIDTPATHRVPCLRVFKLVNFSEYETDRMFRTLDAPELEIASILSHLSFREDFYWPFRGTHLPKNLPRPPFYSNIKKLTVALAHTLPNTAMNNPLQFFPSLEKLNIHISIEITQGCSSVFDVLTTGSSTSKSEMAAPKLKDLTVIISSLPVAQVRKLESDLKMITWWRSQYGIPLASSRLVLLSGNSWEETAKFKVLWKSEDDINSTAGALLERAQVILWWNTVVQIQLGLSKLFKLK